MMKRVSTPASGAVLFLPFLNKLSRHAFRTFCFYPGSCHLGDQLHDPQRSGHVV